MSKVKKPSEHQELKDFISKKLLFQAIKEKNLEGVKKALKRMPDVNVKDGYGESPLHWAACYGWVELINLLIDKGADINIKNSHEFTPLHWAVTERYGYIPCPSGDEIINLLIDRGANINAEDNYGGTPLHWAVRVGRREMIELLISKGAKIKGYDVQTTNESAEIFWSFPS